MPSKLKRNVVIVVTAVAAAAFAGGAYAATQDSGATSRQAFLNDVAKRLHVTPAQLSSALKAASLDQLSAAVASGKLTQAEAKALKQRIEQGAPPLPGLLGLGLPGPGLFGLGLPGPVLAPRLFGPGPALAPRLLGPRPLGPGGPPGWRVAPIKPGIPLPVEPLPAAGGPWIFGGASAYLGVSQVQLFSQLRGGKSLAQIATAHGKSVSGLKSALLASAKARLEKAVAAKLMTSAEEQTVLNHFSAAIGTIVNQPLPGFGLGFAGRPKQWRLPPNGGPAGPATAVPPPQMLPAA